LHRAIHNFIIIFHLVADFGDNGPGDRAEIIIPPINAFTRFAIIRCPTKISWINICFGVGLKAVKLIWPYIMHLASQNGVIAMPVQMMRIGRNGRDKFSRIVIDPGA